jgi:hypothetical protein
MHHGRMTSIAGVLVFASGSIAGAQTGAAKPGQDLDIVRGEAPTLKIRETRFGFLDLNRDGFLQREEVPEDDARLRSQFASLDADKDGRLSRAEYVLSHRRGIP